MPMAVRGLSSPVRQIHSAIIHRVHQRPVRTLKRRRTDHQRARHPARHQDRRLPARADRRSRAARHRRFPRRMARHRPPHRREGGRRNAQTLRQRSREVARRHRPGVGGCCYEIGDEVEREFESQFAYWQDLFEDVFDSETLHARYPLLFLNQRAPGHGDPALSRHLNLVKANRLQLRDAGLAEANISNLGLCTSCRTDLFFSYRKENT